MSASRVRLSSRSSGALSWTKSACAQAVARSVSHRQVVEARALGQPELGQRRPRGLHQVPQPRLGVRSRVPGDHAVAAGQEVGRPAAADDAGADAGDGPDVLRCAGPAHRGFEREDLAALVGGRDLGTHALDDGPRALDELRVGRLDALGQVEVVLQPDPHVAAEQDRLGHPRHLHRAERERRPHGVLRELLRPSPPASPGRPGAPYGMPMQSWYIAGASIRPSSTRVLANHRWPVSKISISTADAELLDLLGALAEHVRGADVDQAALAEVEAAAVERADVGEQLLDVGEPVDAAHQVGAVDERRRVVRVEHQVAAHAGGGVDDDVDVGGPDPLDDLAVERDVPGALAGLWVADVDVDDRGPGACRGDAGLGDLLGGHRHVLGAADGVAGPGQGAGDHDVAVHGWVSLVVTGQRPFQTGLRFSANALNPSRPSSEV